MEGCSPGAGPGLIPGTSEWLDDCLVTLVRIARELIANGRIRICADVMAANVIYIVGSVIRTRCLSVRIGSRVSIERTHFVARMMRGLGKSLLRQSNKRRSGKYCLSVHSLNSVLVFLTALCSPRRS